MPRRSCLSVVYVLDKNKKRKKTNVQLSCSNSACLRWPQSSRPCRGHCNPLAVITKPKQTTPRLPVWVHGARTTARRSTNEPTSDLFIIRRRDNLGGVAKGHPGWFSGLENSCHGFSIFRFVSNPDSQVSGPSDLLLFSLFLLPCVGQLILWHKFGVNSFGHLCPVVSCDRATTTATMPTWERIGMKLSMDGGHK